MSTRGVIKYLIIATMVLGVLIYVKTCTKITTVNGEEKEDWVIREIGKDDEKYLEKEYGKLKIKVKSINKEKVEGSKLLVQKVQLLEDIEEYIRDAKDVGDEISERRGVRLLDDLGAGVSKEEYKNLPIEDKEKIKQILGDKKYGVMGLEALNRYEEYKAEDREGLEMAIVIVLVCMIVLIVDITLRSIKGRGLAEEDD